MSLLLLSTLLPLVALFLTLVFLFTKNKSQDSKLPPGNMGLPFIGETIAFINSGIKGTPEIFVQERMNKFSSQVFKTSLLGEPTIVFCEPPGNKFLFSNQNKLVNIWFPKSVDKIFPFTHPLSNSRESMILRKMLSGFLKPEALHKYIIGTIDSVTKLHFKNFWENKKEITVVPLAKSSTFAVACKVFMSMDDPIQLAKFQHPFSRMFAGIMSLPINIPGTAFSKAIKSSKVIQADLIQIIKQRKIDLANNKASPSQDILSYMLATNNDENGEVTSDADIAARILGLLLGGYDTSSSAIALLVKYLAEHPHVLNEVLAEQVPILKSKAPGELLNWEDIQKMKYSWNVACEVMRLAPPFQGTFRQAITDFDYAGYLIPKGWKLYWSSYSTHKNSKYFPDPEKFDPTRFDGNGPAPFTFVPFGGGPRMCPGKEYARLEICVFIHNLVTKFKWEKVIPDEKIVFDPMPKPANGLPIRLQPRVY